MPEEAVAIQRPQRWDVRFGESMTEADVDRLLTIEPFKDMDPEKFPASSPLRSILLNDTRILKFRDGDIVMREGDYGSSAFIVLTGCVRVSLDRLPGSLLGRKERKKLGFFTAVAQLWTNPRQPETRDYSASRRAQKQVAERRDRGGETRIFLQDVPGVLNKYRTVKLAAGEMFGELAAMSRSPRTATVFAEGETELLEIRWQGLRDLMRRADTLKASVDRLYRQRSLRTHLRETPLLKSLTDEQIDRLAAATQFETFGNFDWQTAFKSAREQTAQEKLAAEPVIAEEGHYPNGLILIRSGFARLSRRFGMGHQTTAYHGKGQVYGIGELAHNWKTQSNLPLQHSLRAVGYVDVLRIPTSMVEQIVLPSLSAEELERHIAKVAAPTLPQAPGPQPQAPSLSPGTLEFLVENRFINGTATMVIDTDRCTRCDDCVRACAAGHDNNPRFVRHGPVFGHHMVANACMHCADPVCMIGCPTGAIHRDEATGNVVINDLTCIGCSTCANSCPYQNIRMVEVRDRSGRFIRDSESNQPIVKATKCDLCSDQLGGPACQRACPHDALRRVDMRERKSLAQWLNR